MLDFPRIQFFIIALLSLIVFPLLTKNWKIHDTILTIGLIVALFIQGSYLINYTPLVSTEVPASIENPSPENMLTLMIANVKMSNRTAQPLLDLIEKNNPDIVLVMEVNEWWENALQPIAQKYPHKQESFNDVTYGMTLYSKYELTDMEINNLNHDKIPSFDCNVQLANGKIINLLTVHPPPPTYFENIPDNEGKEEKAMIKVGEKVKQTNTPTIVAGDFNDVAWSKTNTMTKAGGKLNDVRVGRGFYNSFDATNPLMRWPLDHVFVTKEFSLHQIKRLPKIGSDHFPIYVALVL